MWNVSQAVGKTEITISNSVNTCICVLSLWFFNAGIKFLYYSYKYKQSIWEMTDLKQTQMLEMKAMVAIMTSFYKKATSIFRPTCFPGNSLH